MTHSHVLELGASRQLGGSKASHWRISFRLALNEIAAFAGLATGRPRRAPVPERYTLQAAVMIATARNQR